MTDDPIRAAFEAWATVRDAMWDIDHDRWGYDPHEWAAWQASRAAALEEAAKACDAEASIEGIAQRCAARIRALEAK